MKQYGKLKKCVTACAMALSVALCSESLVQADTPVQGGWVQNGEALSWIQADGTVLTDSVTPDGFYVNAAGIWQTEFRTYLGAVSALPNQFLSCEDAEDLRQWQAWISQLNVQVQQLFQGTRVFHVYEDYITYSKVSNQSETMLLALYRDPASAGWKVKVACSFNSTGTDEVYATSVDYVVLQYLLAFVSHTPEYAADAIYQSWEGENLWNLQTGTQVPVGDCMMTYSVENGAAVYRLTRR